MAGKRARRESAKSTPFDRTAQRLLDAAPDAIVVSDETGRITYANQRAVQLFGYSAAELIGQTIEVLVPESLRGIHVEDRAHYLENPVPRPMGLGLKLVARHKDGTEIPVEISLSAARLDDHINIISTVRDLRERKLLDVERPQPRRDVEDEDRRIADQAQQFRRVYRSLRALMDAIPAAVIFANQEGQVLLSNAVATTMLGVGGTLNLTSTPGYTFQHVDGSPVVPEELPLARALARGETTYDLPLCIRYDDGTERIVLAAATPDLDAQGKIVGAVAVMQDVTEREQRLRLITESSPDTMFFQDRELRYRWIVHPLPPFTEEAIVGKTDVDLYPEPRAAILTAIKQDVVVSGGSASLLLAREVDSQEHYMETAFVPARDANGQIVGVFGYGRDVTPRIRAEQEQASLQRQVEAERAQFATIVAQAINPIIYLNAETGQIRANAAAEKLFGHPLVPEGGREQFAAQEHYPDGRVVPPDELVSSRALRGRSTERAEYLIVRPDGSRVPVIANAAPILLPSGEIDGALSVFQDISDLKELERLREEWISVVAHDLRNPVTVIGGYAALLAKVIPPASPIAASAAGHIETSVRQIKRMIEDLLDVSRIEARQLKLDRRPSDLPALVSSVVQRAAELTRGHVVTVQVHGPIPRVDCDPVRIEQVLVNLLSNAAKYGAPDTPIEVSLAARDAEVEVAATNRGPGISPEEMTALFSRFHRARGAEQSNVPGLGLGLYIAQGLVEAHGGRIWVESTPDETTTFHFTLPVGET